MASPCLVLPLSITVTSLVIYSCPGKDSSFFILSTSCLQIRVIYRPRLELLVRRWPFFFNRERSLSILLIGIPAFKNFPLLFVCMLAQLKVVCCINSAIDCSFNFDIVIFSFDLVCFCDAHWDFRTLFWDDTICLQHHRKFSFL